MTDFQAEDGPVDDGQAGEATTPEDLGVDTQVEAEAPIEYDYLDLDEYGDKYTRVKIDGEEVPVRLADAISGYNSNSVATKRFQEASQLRQEAEEALRLQQAFATSPGLTVQVLAHQAGMSVEDFLGLSPKQQQQAVSEGTAGADEDRYSDPLERDLAVERRERLALKQRLDEREADEYLQRQVDGLKQQYSLNDEQVREVVGQAIRMKVGPEMLPFVYESMAYRRSQVTAQTQTEAAQAAAAAEEQRRQAAARASQTVSAGSGANNVSQGGPPADHKLSLREAFDLAWDGVAVE